MSEEVDKFLVNLWAAIPFLGGLLVLAAGLLGLRLLAGLHQSTRHDFERDWSVLARRRVLGVAGPATGTSRADGPAPDEPGLPGTRAPDPDPSAPAAADPAEDDARFMREDHDYVVGTLFRPIPSLAAIGARTPQQRRLFWRNRMKTRRDRTRLSASMLERSVPAFNNLRQKERWASVLLVDLRLKDKSLCHADFRGCVLIRADLRGADLRGARFTGAIMHDVQFEDALMDEASLRFLRNHHDTSLLGLDRVEVWDRSYADHVETNA